MTSDRRLKTAATMRSWRVLVASALIAIGCTYAIPVQHSLGLFTSTEANASVVSSGTLAAPVALIATATGPGAIQLNWGASPSTFATGYSVYRISGVEPDYTLIAFVPGRATTVYTDTGLMPATVFSYYLVALCGDWTSPPSPAAWAMTIP